MEKRHISITFTTCHLPSKCQQCPGLCLWPLLVCLLTQEASPYHEASFKSLFPGKFYHKTYTPKARNRAAHSIPVPVPEPLVIIPYHQLNCPSIITCQNSFNLSNSTELYCTVVNNVGPRPDWVQIQAPSLEVE